MTAQHRLFHAGTASEEPERNGLANHTVGLIQGLGITP
jgi:hypothetical protein